MHFHIFRFNTDFNYVIQPHMKSNEMVELVGGEMDQEIRG